MHADDLHAWQHSHTFGQELKRPGERRTLIVIAVTGTMMVVEIIAGILTGSMALLADGLHMASHAGALSLNVFAYVYARRHAYDEDFSFGAGKVNALGGFTGAVLLALFALLMAWESVGRLLHPVAIIVDQAILVAILGLAVNGASVFILRVDDHRDHHDHHHHDHNLKAAYLHVLADALTSLLAIVALLCAKYLGLLWMDPVVGIVGAILVSSWSLGLLRSTSGILLDKQGPKSIRDGIRNSIEQDEDSRVTDLHLWSIGPNIYSAVIAIVAHDPATPRQYKERIQKNLGLVHIAVEVHTCLNNTPDGGAISSEGFAGGDGTLRDKP
ncbi:MAG: CDF family Co(II)/Ni(II) efflux transporter DmeF [Nitrospira sp.]|nr:CDF family Co(II)/Ni(II) efflux transporter DmeF [Nitrospira sp.]